MCVLKVKGSLSLCVAGKDEVRGQLDSALQDVNTRYAVLEETEKRAVCRALIEERGRFCSFVSMLKPVLVRLTRTHTHTRTHTRTRTHTETLLTLKCGVTMTTWNK